MTSKELEQAVNGIAARVAVLEAKATTNPVVACGWWDGGHWVFQQGVAHTAVNGSFFQLFWSTPLPSAQHVLLVQPVSSMVICNGSMSGTDRADLLFSRANTGENVGSAFYFAVLRAAP